jgi:hypothetical protein
MDHRPECSGWIEGQFQQVIAASHGSEPIMAYSSCDLEIDPRCLDAGNKFYLYSASLENIIVAGP